MLSVLSFLWRKFDESVYRLSINFQRAVLAMVTIFKIHGALKFAAFTL
jgi:hypothetical protein